MFVRSRMAPLASNGMRRLCDLAHPAGVAKKALHRYLPVEIETGLAVVSSRSIPPVGLREPGYGRLKKTLAYTNAVAVANCPGSNCDRNRVLGGSSRALHPMVGIAGSFLHRES